MINRPCLIEDKYPPIQLLFMVWGYDNHMSDLNFNIEIIEEFIKAIDRTISASDELSYTQAEAERLYEKFIIILLGKYIKRSDYDLRSLPAQIIPIQVKCKRHKKHYLKLASITSGDVCFYSRKDRSYVSCIEYEGYGDDSMLITYIIQSLPEIIRYLNEVAREREERAKQIKANIDRVYQVLRPFIIAEELDEHKQ